MTLDLNTNIDNSLAGFRLDSLDVLNWGTFHEAIWTITPDGKNALLTGDIGSGKSTLVDAITTLLVPAKKIVYNKAAGAATKERSLKTYVQGAYKNEKVADSARARDVYLRVAGKSYSVLIANFRNAGTGEEAALTQVLWMGTGNAVQRLYLIGHRKLSVATDFSSFGGDINALRRKLRGRDDITLHNTFTNYANDFRRRFGIRQEEALDLFYQTVSMKQVGNLTSFVRERMLGRTDIEKQIETLVKSYDDANAAHQAVLAARRQLEILNPLVEADTSRQKVLARITELEMVRTEIPRYFAHRKIAAGQAELATILKKHEANAAERTVQARLLQDRTAALERLRAVLNGNDVYRQLAPLESQIADTERELDRRRTKADAYAAGIQRLNEATGTEDDKPDPLASPGSPQAFATQREILLARLADTNDALLTLDREKGPLHVAESRARQAFDELDSELTSLRERPTLIPRRNLELRDRLLRELELDAAELPYAGELLRVRENAAEWEGAIERVLYGLGLSLLVPDRHYARLSEVVNRLHLGGKLVYLRTLPHRGRASETPTGENLPQKVKIKGDSEHYDWLERELDARYDYQCCNNLEEFQRAAKGLTRNGQTKASRHRHDKDDRHRVDDRSRYVLGWSNEEKIRALENERNLAEQTLADTLAQLNLLRTRDRAQNVRRDVLLDLTNTYPDFPPLDFAESSRRLQELRREHATLQARSGEVTELQGQIAERESELSITREAGEQLAKKTGQLENESFRLANTIRQLLARLSLPAPGLTIDPDNPDVPAIAAAFRGLELAASEPSPALIKLLGPTPDTANEHELLGRFDGDSGLLSRQQKKLRTHENRIVRQMTEFRKDFPDEARNVDADLEALPDFHQLHEKLKRDKLPGFEDNFRQLLKEGTIRNIVSFQNQLRKYEQEISDKIGKINEHLHDIDYNDGTYVVITSEAVRSDDIAGFKRALRDCLSGTLDGDKDVYNERKFQQVKKLLDRFEGVDETDRRWTARVTDVREWYEFGADERGRDDDKSREFYSDSSGKSGGQKEKLAYTILASAIAFQFGLQVGRSTDRSFRFVMIDEAFGKGSDDSTRFGLRLFERLNLQLLIVTPLQKINVIEDYVSTVHYVDNPGGKNSRVRNIGIAEYQKEKKIMRQQTEDAR
jgi:uncharacterized protein YPO0396